MKRAGFTSSAGCSWTRCLIVDPSRVVLIIVTKYVCYGPGSKLIELLYILCSALEDVGTGVYESTGVELNAF